MIENLLMYTCAKHCHKRWSSDKAIAKIKRCSFFCLTVYVINITAAYFNKIHGIFSEIRTLENLYRKNLSFQYRNVYELRYKSTILQSHEEKNICQSTCAYLLNLLKVCRGLGMSTLGRTDLTTFIKPVAKISSAYFHDVLFGQNLLPAICSMAQSWHAPPTVVMAIQQPTP